VKITQVTIGYGETQSLPEYSNVKPSATFTATIEDGDDLWEVEQQLWDLAKGAVRAQIDATLEFHGKPAKYDPSPRFQVMRTYWNKWENKGAPEPPRIVVVFPNEMDAPKDIDARLVHAGYGESRKLRYAHALDVARGVVQDNEGYTIVDCSDGDLSRLEAALKTLPAPAPEIEAENPF